jgi:two-component system nitrate/nitrite response regulator NarL
MTRILIIEDHRLVAQGLVLGLGAEGFEVRSTEGQPSALAALLAEFSPEVVLLDIYLGEGRSGISLLPLLRAPERAVMVLTGETDPLILARALQAGANTVLGKSAPFSQLLTEIRAVAQGKWASANQRRQEVLNQARIAQQQRFRELAPFSTLTPREEEILALLLQGVRAADIAERSYVSLSTVRSQIRSILAKLGVSSQLSAVSLAVSAGWTPVRTALRSPPQLWG